MKLLQLTIIVFCSVVGFCQHNQAPSDFDCKTISKTCTINIANQNPSKDEKTAGPKKIIVTGANTLRYDYVFSSTITFSSPPPIDLSTLGTMAKTSTPDTKAQDSTQKQKATASTTATKLSALKASSQGRAQVAEIAALDMDAMSKTIDEVFTKNEQELNTLADEVNRIVEAANEAAQAVNLAALDMRALLLNSDSTLRTGGANALEREIDRRRLVGECPAKPSSFQLGLCTNWPAIPDGLVNRVKALQGRVRQNQDVAAQNSADDEARLSSLDFAPASQSTPVGIQKGNAAVNNQQQALSNKTNVMNVWIMRRTVYAAVKAQTDDQGARLDEVLKKLADLGPGGKSNADFLTAQQDLRNWNERMITVTQTAEPSRTQTIKSPTDQNEELFTLPSHKAPCVFAFAGTKAIKVELIQTDRLPLAVTVMGSNRDSSSAKTVPATPKAISLITVECTSPFVMSAGVAFSSITERDFVIQKDSDGQNRFATDAHSNFHPLPLAMVNMRYKEFNRFWALYGSFGVAANIKGQSAGGSDPEYLFTPLTFGFFRTAFISPALHIGRDVRLGSNFHEGDIVPASITTPPLQKSYKMGFGIAITFTKP
jgi:hypothetical protein